MTVLNGRRQAVAFGDGVVDIIVGAGSGRRGSRAGREGPIHYVIKNSTAVLDFNKNKGNNNHGNIVKCLHKEFNVHIQACLRDAEHFLTDMWCIDIVNQWTGYYNTLERRGGQSPSPLNALLNNHHLE